MDDKDKRIEKLKRRIAGLEETIQIVSRYSGRFEENLRQLFDSVSKTIPVPMLIATEAGDILFFNQKAQEIFGYSKKDFSKLNATTLYETSDARNAFLERVKDTGEVKDFIVHFRKADGEIFPASLFSQPIAFEGRNCLLTVIYDLSEIRKEEKKRLEVERQLRQTQKMEALGTMAGGIAHDFNNILSAIFGYTELALSQTDPAKIHYDLEQILVGARRAKELVQQILTFSRQTEQERQPIDITVILKEALRMLRSSIPTTIEIRQKIVKTGTVLADATQIHQVIMNLCTNAYHAMRETGGTLAVTSEEVCLRKEDEYYGELAPGKYLKIEVSDTGCGIDPELQRKIFEPYFTTKKVGEGTGLGLSVVHGIVKKHHGNITVYSEQGVGTTFHVYLPLVTRDIAEQETGTPVVDLDGNGEHILFVDDEQQIREIAEKLFTRYSYRVTTTKHGVQALEDFQNHPDQYDLIITDMTMPYMTGADLARKIRDIRPDIPIILCTGQSELINRESALAMGICEYLTKPVLSHDFLSAIGRALGKKK